MKTFTWLALLVAITVAKEEEKPSKLRGREVQLPLEHLRKSVAPKKYIDVDDEVAVTVFAPENDPDFEKIFVVDEEPPDEDEDEGEDGNGRKLSCSNTWYCYSCRSYKGYGNLKKCYYCQSCSGSSTSGCNPCTCYCTSDDGSVTQNGFVSGSGNTINGINPTLDQASCTKHCTRNSNNCVGECGGDDTEQCYGYYYFNC